MKVAIVHDYLNQLGGAERVVGVLHETFPDAPIYTLFIDRERLWPSLEDATIIPTFLQKIPFIRRKFKWFFWLYPLAVKCIRPVGFDIVISSSSAYAKGYKKGSEFHVCYCHTPMRFAWNFDDYISRETNIGPLKVLAKLLIQALKKWDIASNANVDMFVANSTVVQGRIRRLYQREAGVIFPPVTIPKLQDCPPYQQGEYFLVVSRLVGYKRIDLAVQACSKAGHRLVVIGEGPDRRRLQSLAGPSVEFLGWQSEDLVQYYMATCKAFIFPGEEDFGITPLEVAGFGRPVVAFKAGGALDTIIEGVTGVFFDTSTPESLNQAIDRLLKTDFDTESIQQWALRFRKEVFQRSMNELVTSIVGDDSLE